MNVEGAWADLETRGYVLVRGLLDAEEIAALVDDAAKAPDAARLAFGLKPIGSAVTRRIWAKIDPLLAEVRASTSLGLDIPAAGYYIDTEKATARTRGWHQDFDLDYRLSGDHRNYLNLYVPIVKPDPRRSNMTVVPLDALRASSEAAYAALLGRGGLRMLAAGDGRTAVFGDGVRILPEDLSAETPGAILDVDLAALSFTPDLSAGDLFAVRGDIVHRAQDADTHRVAASFRATASSKVLHRARLADDGSPIARVLADGFASLGRDITLEELYAFVNRGRSAAVQRFGLL